MLESTLVTVIFLDLTPLRVQLDSAAFPTAVRVVTMTIAEVDLNFAHLTPFEYRPQSFRESRYRQENSYQPCHRDLCLQSVRSYLKGSAISEVPELSLRAAPRRRAI